MGQWGSVSPLIREAQSPYSSALRQRLNEHKFSAKESSPGWKMDCSSQCSLWICQQLNIYVFGVDVGLASKESPQSRSPSPAEPRCHLQTHHNLEGFLKTSRGFLCRMRIITFQQSDLSSFHNSLPQSQSSLAPAGRPKPPTQHTTRVAPVTLFCCVLFFSWPSMNCEVGFASRGSGRTRLVLIWMFLLPLDCGAAGRVGLVPLCGAMRMIPTDRRHISAGSIMHCECTLLRELLPGQPAPLTPRLCLPLSKHDQHLNLDL